MKLKIAICDDERLAVGAIKGAVIKAFAENGLSVEVSEFYDAKSLISAVKTGDFRLVMLDISMPDMNGIAIGRLIRKNQIETDIVYISSCESRVFDALEVQPKSFIRKSHFFKDLKKCVELLADEYRASAVPALALEGNNGIVAVPVDKVIYVEGRLKDQHLYTELREEAFRMRRSMKQLNELLEEHGFIRVHVSYIVNFRHIAVFKKDEVLLNDGTALPLSRANAREAKERYLKLMKNSGNITI